MPLLKPVYLDNAATSHPKPEEVYQAVTEALHRGSSSGRGTHRHTITADRLVFETREALCELFNGTDSSSFVFTPNATTAINIALFGLLSSGDRIVTTSMEHNAVIRPLHELAKRGVTVVKVAADPLTGLVAPFALKAACLKTQTRILLVNHCSNVLGSLQDLAGLGSWCRENNILFMVDGAQSAGSIPVDFKALEIDLFAAPGHKGLLGPQGTGFLYVRPGIEIKPFVFGGTGTYSHLDHQPAQLPERLESGTLNLPGLAGLHAAIQYLTETGVNTIRMREMSLVDQLMNGLKEIGGVTIYGPESLEERGSVISFNLAGYDPAQVGYVLDQEYEILLRTGLHCSPEAHRTVGTFPTGTVRVSPGHFTTEDEIDYFLDAVIKLAQQKPF